MGGLLHLVQRGGAWAGCTKCNSQPTNGQCTNFVLFDVALLPLESKGFINVYYYNSRNQTRNEVLSLLAHLISHMRSLRTLVLLSSVRCPSRGMNKVQRSLLSTSFDSRTVLTTPVV